MAYELWKLIYDTATLMDYARNPTDDDLKSRILTQLEIHIPEIILINDRTKGAILKELNGLVRANWSSYQGEGEKRQAFSEIQTQVNAAVGNITNIYSTEIIEKSIANEELSKDEKGKLEKNLDNSSFIEYLKASEYGPPLTELANKYIDDKWQNDENLWLSTSDRKLLQIEYMKTIVLNGGADRDDAINKLEQKFDMLIKQSLWLDEEERVLLKQEFFKDVISAPQKDKEEASKIWEKNWSAVIENKKLDKNKDYMILKEQIELLRESNLGSGIDYDKYLRDAEKEVYGNLSRGWPPKCTESKKRLYKELSDNGLESGIEIEASSSKTVDILTSDDAKLNTIGAIHRAASSTASKLSLQHYFDITMNMIVGIERMIEIKEIYIDLLADECEKLEEEARKLPKSDVDGIAKLEIKVKQNIKDRVEIIEKNKEYEAVLDKLQQYVGINDDFNGDPKDYSKLRDKFVNSTVQKQKTSEMKADGLDAGVDDTLNSRHKELSERLVALTSRRDEVKKSKGNKKLIGRIEDEMSFIVLELNLEKQKSLFQYVASGFETSIMTDIAKEPMSIHDVTFWTALHQSMQSVQKINAASIVSRTLTARGEHYSQRETDLVTRSTAAMARDITQEEVSKRIISVFEAATGDSIEQLQNAVSVLIRVDAKTQAEGQTMSSEVDSYERSIFGDYLFNFMSMGADETNIDSMSIRFKMNYANEVLESTRFIIDAFKPIDAHKPIDPHKLTEQEKQEKEVLENLEKLLKTLAMLENKCQMIDKMMLEPTGTEQNKEINGKVKEEKEAAIEALAKAADEIIKYNAIFHKVALRSENVTLQGASTAYSGVIDSLNLTRNTSNTIEKAYESYLEDSKAELKPGENEETKKHELGLPQKLSLAALDLGVEKSLKCNKMLLKQYKNRVSGSLVMPKKSVKRRFTIMATNQKPVAIDASPEKSGKRYRLGLAAAATHAARAVVAGKISMGKERNEIKINDFNHIVEAFHSSYQISQAELRFDMLMESSRLLATLDNDLESPTCKLLHHSFNIVNDSAQLYGRYEASGGIIEQIATLELQIGDDHEIPKDLIERLNGDNPTIEDKIEFQKLFEAELKRNDTGRYNLYVYEMNANVARKYSEDSSFATSYKNIALDHMMATYKGQFEKIFDEYNKNKSAIQSLNKDMEQKIEQILNLKSDVVALKKQIKEEANEPRKQDLEKTLSILEEKISRMNNNYMNNLRNKISHEQYLNELISKVEPQSCQRLMREQIKNTSQGNTANKK
mgnify:FL=1